MASELTQGCVSGQLEGAGAGEGEDQVWVTGSKLSALGNPPVTVLLAF